MRSNIDGLLRLTILLFNIESRITKPVFDKYFELKIELIQQQIDTSLFYLYLLSQGFQINFDIISLKIYRMK